MQAHLELGAAETRRIGDGFVDPGDAERLSAGSLRIGRKADDLTAFEPGRLRKLTGHEDLARYLVLSENARGHEKSRENRQQDTAHFSIIARRPTRQARPVAYDRNEARLEHGYRSPEGVRRCRSE